MLFRSSQPVQGARERGRGRPVAPKSTARIHGDRRGEQRCWRGIRASGVAWLSEGVEDEVAELLGVERGSGGGGGYGERRRWRRAPLGGVRERGAEEGMGSRVREERCRGRGGVRGSLGCLQRRAGKQEVAGACARASGTRPPAYWQEVEDGGDRGGLGHTVLDQHRSWAGSGGLHG